MEEGPNREELLNRISDLEFNLRRDRLENRERIKEILQQILETHDGLSRLIQIASKQEWPSEVRSFMEERFSLIGKKLLQILFRAGAIKFESLGQPVNYEYHEVVGEKAKPDVKDGTIVEVVSDGYALEGDVLRMAKVIVATKS